VSQWIIFFLLSLKPIGSASIAQVYKAVLKNGDNVAVKIQRPGIKEVFEIDFLIISFLASAVDLLSFFSALSAKELVGDLIRWTRKELDFRNESNNAVAFLKYRQETSTTVIPKQYQEYARPRVLVQEFIQGGISVLDVVLGKYSRKQLIDRGINLDQMAVCLLKEGMKEYFIDGFFHADPHPANLALLPGDKESPDGKLVLFDFGIVGEAEKENRLILLRFVYSISAKNIEMMAKYLLEYGKKNLRKEIDQYFQVERGKQKIVEEIMVKIEGITVSHFKEDIQEIAESWFSVEKDSGADFKSRSSATFFLSMVQKAEKYGVHFSLDIILFFRGLVIDDMVALQMSPQFDIMKVMEGFFIEHPVEEIEEKIRNQTNWQEIDKKIVSVNDDWESFVESSMRYKEKAMIVKEKTLEMVFYYAERYLEIKDLISKL